MLSGLRTHYKTLQLWSNSSALCPSKNKSPGVSPSFLCRICLHRLMISVFDRSILQQKWRPGENMPSRFFPSRNMFSVKMKKIPCSTQNNCIAYYTEIKYIPLTTFSCNNAAARTDTTFGRAITGKYSLSTVVSLMYVTGNYKIESS